MKSVHGAAFCKLDYLFGIVEEFLKVFFNFSIRSFIEFCTQNISILSVP